MFIGEGAHTSQDNSSLPKEGTQGPGPAFGLTESLMADNIETVIGKMTALRARGVDFTAHKLRARYATRFSVVEINTSFYRSHRQATYGRWADAVPPEFHVSVKMPKSISNDMAL